MSNENVLFQVEDDELENHAQEDESVGIRKYLIFTADYILGIFNMRGQIIPIMDIRLRLGKPPVEEGILIVIDYNNNQLGIRVDSVDLMLDIPNDSIVPIPSQSAQKLVSGMCTLPDGSGTMLVLDCEQLIAHGYGD